MTGFKLFLTITEAEIHNDLHMGVMDDVFGENDPQKWHKFMPFFLDWGKELRDRALKHLLRTNPKAYHYVANKLKSQSKLVAQNDAEEAKRKVEIEREAKQRRKEHEAEELRKQIKQSRAAPSIQDPINDPINGHEDQQQVTARYRRRCFGIAQEIAAEKNSVIRDKMVKQCLGFSKYTRPIMLDMLKRFRVPLPID